MTNKNLVLCFCSGDDITVIMNKETLKVEGFFWGYPEGTQEDFSYKGLENEYHENIYNKDLTEEYELMYSSDQDVYFLMNFITFIGDEEDDYFIHKLSIAANGLRE